MDFDRRQRKTKAAVRSALISLLAEKDMSEISVTDIAKRADINRSTFYLHYRDAADVLGEMESEIIEEVMGFVVENDMKELTVHIFPIVKKVHDGLGSIPELKQFLTRDGGIRVYHKIQNTLCEKLTAVWTYRYPKTNQTYLENAVTFIMGGVFAAYAKWMNGGDNEPLDKLCEFLDQMITEGISALKNKLLASEQDGEEETQV